jgi:hypothetical protein
MGYQVPPGISDATVPNPVFNLTPAATVDEGNNWVNMSWGPLAMTNPATGVTLGNYALAAGSPAINYIPPTTPAGAVAPHTDFFGNPRPATPGTGIDVGAVEFQGAGVAAPTLTSISPNTGARGTTVPVTLTGTNLTGATGHNGLGGGVSVVAGTFKVVSSTTITATLNITATAGLTTRNVRVTKPGPNNSNTVPFTVQNGVTIAPIPLMINVTGSGNATGTVTFTAGGQQVKISTVAVSGGSALTWFFSVPSATDHCTGTTLAPGANCTVGVGFTNVTGGSGTNHNGMVTVTDNAASQNGALIGHVN